jgi:PAS domain S-box-containing protein
MQALQRQKSKSDLREAYENLKLHSTKLQIRSEKLQKTTEIMDAISQNSSELLFVKDCQSRIIYANDSFLRFFGKSADEILDQTDVDFYFDPLISEAVVENDRIVREVRQSLVTEESVRLQDGSLRIYLSTKSPWLAKDSTLLGTIGFFVDITKRKRAEQESEMMVEFLQLVNNSKGIVDLVHSAVNFSRESFGFEAVGIRLKCDEDYPYFETSGFSAEFVKLENSLCVRDASGQLIHDSNGYPIHDCMCGNDICGRFDPSKPFFTTL